MALKNYFSKIELALRITRKFSFLKLLINSKKFSAFEKSGRSFKKIPVETELYDLKLDGKVFQLAMRTYRGDINIFYEVFWRKVYQIPDTLLAKPKLIVDLGAHIGLASIYFAMQYKDAKIISVEASSTNFQLLKENTNRFGNITCINKAIYSNDGWINFNNEATFSYNTRVSKTGTAMQCMSMPGLMNDYDLESIDLLKIDIEGAETVLLSENNAWLHKVRHIIIELHEPYDLEHLRVDLQPFGFKFFLPGEGNQLSNIFITKIL